MVPAVLLRWVILRGWYVVAMADGWLLLATSSLTLPPSWSWLYPCDAKQKRFVLYSNIERLRWPVGGLQPPPSLTL